MYTEGEGSSGMDHEPRPKTDRDLFPYMEDWDALQGGRPRVFRNPRKPQSVWIVLHVYESHPEAKKRFKSGAIVQTAPPEDGKIKMVGKLLKRRDFEGNLIDREFKIPSFMDRSVHGDACGTRSTSQGGGDYERITNQAEYDAYLEKLRNDGFQEIRFGVNDDGFTLQPVKEIARSRPLGPPPQSSPQN